MHIFWNTSRKTQHPLHGMLIAAVFSILWRFILASGSRGYFNKTSAILKTVIDLRHQTVFGIRTCSLGQIIYQKGTSGDYFNVSLSSTGSLEIRWSVNGTVDGDTIGSNINQNSWITVDIKFDLGKVKVSVEEGATVKFLHVISNSSATYRRYLWDISLSGGDLVVGGDIVACISEGSTIELSQAVSDTGVVWNSCPLDSESGCGTDDINDCWNYPCKNGGTCKDGFKSYTCDCATGYGGSDCQTFFGSIGCSLDPCKYNSTCQNVTTTHLGYECICLDGYVGVNCEIDINECSSSPCKNNGFCTDAVNSYRCNCSGTGYQGSQCTNDIDECTTLSPCVNGSCSNTFGSYKCSCTNGYGGKNCDAEVNECLSNPCQNGGQCHDYLAYYNCSCPVGYTGIHCEDNVNDCLGVQCSANRECKDGLNMFTCDCKAGYTGTSNTTDPCVETDECLSSPCQNNATCKNLVNAFECSCVAGFIGTFCETDIDECSGHPCLNGKCHDKVNHYRCECYAGWTGDNCTENIDECHPDPCINGAKCNDQINGYNCTCTQGWTGENCTEDILECNSNPCQNGGKCNELTNGYNCSCVLGFNGTHCEVNIDDCLSAPCWNGGACIDGINGYTCNCTSEYMGTNCTEKYNACSFAPCMNGATCHTTIGQRDHNCTCILGYDGKNCKNNIDDCMNVTCPYSNVCYDGVNNYTCACPTGFAGVNCTDNINECAAKPCKNGGECKDGIGNYTCVCPQRTVDLTEYGGSRYVVGYNGTNCENTIDACDLEICLNGNTCVLAQSPLYYRCQCDNATAILAGYVFTGFNCEVMMSYCDMKPATGTLPKCKNGGTCAPSFSGIGGINCTCASGFTGPTCEIDIDECASNPCQYNGKCTDKVNGYVCECLPGLNGTNCEINIDECLSNPCQHGSCLDKINSYECNCTDTGFNGTHCELNIDDCVGSPCQNGGVCNDLIKDYNCSCFAGYAGKNCETDIDECLSTPCQYNGTCLQKSNQTLYNQVPKLPGFEAAFNYSTADGYVCQCLPGFKGVECEINIDECDPDPCVNGNCTDGYNKYTCNCLPGYRGVNCSIDIDECSEPADPCQFGSTCTQKVADYDCACPSEFQGKKYGGKNCTTELTGCVNNGCKNGAACVPFLVNEAQGVHNYTCTCTVGWAGHYCDVTTVASFNGTTHWPVLNKNQDSASVEIGFRTTLQNGILAFSGDPKNISDSFYTLELSQMKVTLSYKMPGKEKEQIIIDTAVNDAAWHHVKLVILNTSLSLTLENCGVTNCTEERALTAPLVLGGTTSLGQIAAPDLKTFSQISSSVSNFIGCTRDIIVDSTKLVPSEYVAKVDHLIEGCPRTEVCIPDPCNARGDCIDEWIEPRCSCRRPYFGVKCENVLPASTFGLGQKKSFAWFVIAQDKAKLMEIHTEISLFIRTRNTAGFVIYVGGDTSATNVNTFISLEIVSGKISVRTKLAADVEVTNGNRYVSDGQQYKLDLTRDGCQLTVTLQFGSAAAFKDIDMTLSKCTSTQVLTVKNVYMGSLPGWTTSRRRKRAVDINGSSSQTPFVGTLQDARLGTYSLQLFPPSGTGQTPSVIAAARKTNIAEGEKTEDMCKLLSNPCEYNGTCQNMFYNDYNCTCVTGYTGKNCSNIDYCLYSTCPGGASCRDKPNGYECISPATFNGESSQIDYNLTLNATDMVLESISLKVRTRKTSGIILDTTDGKFRLSLNNGKVKFEMKGPTGQTGSAQYILKSKQTVNDGSYHNITIKIIATSIDLDVDSTIATKTGENYTVSIPNGYSGLSVGGVSASAPFKGCLDDVNVNGYNLPVFKDAELVNDTRLDKFSAQVIKNITIGCEGDPVCATNDCKNNATCQDIWNDYTCKCVLGFNGTKCENNIPDCPKSNCSQPGTKRCVDGINSFSCDCKPGYRGTWCETDIDECAVDPCINNGTCTDKINDFSCNCTANFTGKTCDVPIGRSCKENPCVNGSCTDVNVTTSAGKEYSSFNCSCYPGYEGRVCDTLINYCKVDPCKNKAVCKNDYIKYDWSCQCVPGYEGKDCGTETNECAPKPCLHGTCKDLFNDYNCTCEQGWEGKNCSTDIKECSQVPPICQNSGKCIEQAGSYNCDCAGTGYSGNNCQSEIDECGFNQPICQNSATCKNEPLGSYTCSCTLGYKDKNCSTANCSAVNCQNSGNCSVKTDGQWMCQCPKFYEGNLCQTKGPCADAPCNNSAVCSQDIATMNYTCQCTKGWQGTNCDQDINECDANPCKNGNCTNFDGGYNCTCNPGYEGFNCSVDINECADKPCKNGGVCSDQVNKYQCNCAGTGFEGINCTVNIDECTVNQPCLNGGTCKDTIGSYTCTCLDPYVGKTCHSENPCNKTICQNGGTCGYNISEADQKAVGFCTCLSGFSGAICEKAASSQLNLVIIIAPIAALVVLIILIVIIVFVMTARKKRATRGTYSPSRQELEGSRVEMGNVLKQPPEERLI
ncbi:protein crumbs-like [Lineus longissimus]|uniref:protein crumbs-like n=1 Tax=Lineus longissimus TaxID=88925 RepID=UPI002B4DC8E3